jgi:hypothetical protein
MLLRALEYIRRTPAAAFGRFAALLCGIALTWTCAAAGLMIYSFSTAGCHGPAKVRPAKLQVRNIAFAIAMYQIGHNRCPATKYDLIAERDVSERDLVDPWGRSIAYWCTEEDSSVTSAGRDGIFGTFDDITYPEPSDD